MALSQVQIIRSLGEALAWFEKELSWNVEAAELRHLTGRIGELYAAMITRGQMALATNQRGYDVVSAEGEHISVKTFTSSTHGTFRKSTFSEVDRVMILRINVDETEASIEEIFDARASELLGHCKETSGGDYLFPIGGRRSGPARPLEELQVTAEARVGERVVRQYENGTVIVETAGTREPMTKPMLREMAAELGVSLLNSNGNPRNTRQLGAEVIAALTAAKPDEVTTS